MSVDTQDPITTVREAIAAVKLQGGPTPGRGRLVELTGLSEHQVKKALADLASSRPVQPADAKRAVGLLPRQSTGSGPLGGNPDVPSGASGDLDIQAPPADIQPPPGPVQPSPAQGRRWRLPPHWPLFFIGLAAGVAVWSGWVGLGQLAGFGEIQPLPGIWDDLRINTSIVLPVSVEAYAAYALRCWLSKDRYTRRTILFSMWSAISSLVIGAGAQIAYHLMAAAGLTRAPWQITMLVACVPVVVLGLASALAKLVTSDLQAGERR